MAVGLCYVYAFGSGRELWSNQNMPWSRKMIHGLSMHKFPVLYMLKFFAGDKIYIFWVGLHLQNQKLHMLCALACGVCMCHAILSSETVNILVANFFKLSWNIISVKISTYTVYCHHISMTCCINHECSGLRSPTAYTSVRNTTLCWKQGVFPCSDQR